MTDLLSLPDDFADKLHSWMCKFSKTYIDVVIPTIKRLTVYLRDFSRPRKWKLNPPTHAVIDSVKYYYYLRQAFPDAQHLRQAQRSIIRIRRVERFNRSMYTFSRKKS